MSVAASVVTLASTGSATSRRPRHLCGGGHADHRRRRTLTRWRLRPTAVVLGQSFFLRCQEEKRNMLICRPFRADDGARTHDLLHGKQTLYQLSYIRESSEYS